MRQLYADAQKHPAQAGQCPTGDNNLAETLSIRDFVAMGLTTDRAIPKPAPKTPAEQQDAQQKGATITTATEAFGGVITFLVTKSISSFGPTYVTSRWKGPGGLVGLSEVNTEKLTLAFAAGPNAGQPVPKDINAIVPNGPNSGAYSFTQQQLNQSINTQFQMLQNQLVH